MSRRPCPLTLDLFDDYEPPELARFDPSRVKGSNDRARIARGVSETLDGADQPREAVAEAMTALSGGGDAVSKMMLDAYASTAKEAHTISLERAWRLFRVTGDPRLFQMILESEGFAVIEAKYLPWIEAGMLAEKRDELNKRLDATRRAAKRGLRNV